MLTSENAITHVTGCVKCTGNNASSKHHAMVKRLHELCAKAGIPCELEPRHLSSYKCAACGDTIEGDRKVEHQRTCGTASFHRSGPDLAIHWASGVMYYDFTIVHELSQSNLSRTGTQLMKDAISRKVKTYVASGLLNSSQFQCVPILSGGAMHTKTKQLIHALADACGYERNSTVQDFTLRLQELNGAVALSQLKKYLVSPLDEDSF